MRGPAGGRPGRPRSYRDSRPRLANRDVGRCQYTGKKRYVNRADAKAVKRMTGSTAAVYRCADCGHFELGGKYGMSRDEHQRIAEYKHARRLDPTLPQAIPPRAEPEGTTTPHDLPAL